MFLLCCVCCFISKNLTDVDLSVVVWRVCFKVVSRWTLRITYAVQFLPWYMELCCHCCGWCRSEGIVGTAQCRTATRVVEFIARSREAFGFSVGGIGVGSVVGQLAPPPVYGVPNRSADIISSIGLQETFWPQSSRICNVFESVNKYPFHCCSSLDDILLGSVAN